MRTTATLRDIALVVALLLIVVVGWLPGILRGEEVTIADDLFTMPPWDAVRPEGFTTPSNKLLFDQLAQVYPWADYARERLQRGELPLWNPWNAGGTSFVANQNASLFSPLHLPLLLVSETATGITLIAILKILLALAGAYVLARSFGVSRTGSAAAGAIFALSGPSWVWLGHPLTTVSPFLPWSVLAVAKAVRAESSAGRLRWCAVLGLVTGAHLAGGHPETSLHTVIFSALFALIVSGGTTALRARVGKLTLVAGTLVLGSLVASVQVVPFADALLRSHPRAMRLAERPKYVLPATALPLAISPLLYGSPQDLNHREDLLGNMNFAETSLFAGVLPLVLIPAAWPTLRRRREFRALAILGAVGLWLAFDPIPIIGQMIHAVPILGLGAHHRLVLWWVLALAILAGAGIDAVTDRHAATSRTGALAASIFGLGLLAWGVAIVLGNGAWFPRLFVHGAVAALLLVIVPALLQLRDRISPPRTAGVLLILALMDLWAFGRTFNPTLEATQIFPDTATTRFLTSAAADSRVLTLGSALPVNTTMPYRIRNIRGYEPLFGDHLQKFWWQIGTEYGIWSWTEWQWLRAPTVLPLLGVSHVVVPTGYPPPRVGDTTLRRVHDGDADIYAVTDTVPLVFTRHAWDPVENVTEAGRRLAADYDYRERVLLESAPNPVPTQASGNDRLTFERESPERIVIEAEMKGAGLVILGEVSDPGWRATVDGEVRQILGAYGIFQAVAVEAGQHHVVYSYEPRGWRLGIALSLVGLAGLALLVLASFRTTRAAA